MTAACRERTTRVVPALRGAEPDGGWDGRPERLRSPGAGEGRITPRPAGPAGLEPAAARIQQSPVRRPEISTFMVIEPMADSIWPSTVPDMVSPSKDISAFIVIDVPSGLLQVML